MSEYDHLRKQNDAMVAKHFAEAVSRFPFGCPHGCENFRLKYEGSQRMLAKAMAELTEARASNAALKAERDGCRTAADLATEELVRCQKERNALIASTGEHITVRSELNSALAELRKRMGEAE